MNKNEPFGLYDISDSAIKIIQDSQKSLLDEPVNIVELSKKLGVKKVLKSNLGKDISGKIEKREEGFVILTNKAEAKKRRRFTIAHELAHFILHKSQIDNGITENCLYRSGLSNQCEVEANRFAADVLMPLDKIQEYIDEEGTDKVSIGNLAAKFNVSISAIKVRLGIPSNLY